MLPTEDEDVNDVPHRFVTVDPGLQCSGVALWFSGALVDVTLVRCPKDIRGIYQRVGMQSLILGGLLRAWRTQHPLKNYEAIMADEFPVVSERMFHRHFRGNRVDPNDLINLNLLSGRLGTHYVLPSEWKGNVPRDVEQSQTMCSLSERELALVEAVKPASLRKEAWSAVGIGLSLLSRAHQKMGWSFT